MIPTDERTAELIDWCAERASERRRDRRRAAAPAGRRPGGDCPAWLAASVAIVFVANVFIIVVRRNRIPLE